MTKNEFLMALKQQLAQLPQSEIERFLSYYDEMIADRIEEGLSEQEAVASMEDVHVIAERILYEMPLHTLVKSKAKEKTSGGLTALTIVLLVLGFPLWFPLLLTVVIVLFTIFLVIWVVALVLAVCVIAVACSGLAAIVAGIATIPIFPPLGLAAIGSGLAFSGLCIFLFFGVKLCIQGLAKLSKRFFRWIKSLFIRKKKGGEHYEA